jgi:hypothetical protein
VVKGTTNSYLRGKQFDNPLQIPDIDIPISNVTGLVVGTALSINSTAWVDITNLGTTLQPGNYIILGLVIFNKGGSGSGCKIQATGTCTYSDLAVYIGDTVYYNFNTAYANSGSGISWASLEGSILVTAPGTFQIQATQLVGLGGTLTIYPTSMLYIINA